MHHIAKIAIRNTLITLVKTQEALRLVAEDSEIDPTRISSTDTPEGYANGLINEAVALGPVTIQILLEVLSQRYPGSPALQNLLMQLDSEFRKDSNYSQILDNSTILSELLRNAIDSSSSCLRAPEALRSHSQNSRINPPNSPPKTHVDLSSIANAYGVRSTALGTHVRNIRKDIESNLASSEPSGRLPELESKLLLRYNELYTKEVELQYKVIEIGNQSYQLKEHISSGNFADIWSIHNSDYVVRLLKPVHYSNEATRSRFITGIYRQKRFENSKHIVRVISGPHVDETSQQAIAILERIQGPNLKEAILNDPSHKDSLFGSHLRKVLLDIAYALETIHEANHAHRDVCPSNILIYQKSSSFRAKLTDFDTVSIESCTQGTVRLSEFGTWPYTAPELRANHKEASGELSFNAKSSDIYSFCMVVYFTLYRSSLQSQEFGAALNESGTAGRIDKLPANPNVKRFLKKGLCDSSSERHASMTEVIEELRNLDLVPKPNRYWLRKQRQWAISILLVAVATILFGIITISIDKQTEAKDIIDSHISWLRGDDSFITSELLKADSPFAEQVVGLQSAFVTVQTNSHIQDTFVPALHKGEKINTFPISHEGYNYAPSYAMWSRVGPIDSEGLAAKRSWAAFGELHRLLMKHKPASHSKTLPRLLSHILATKNLLDDFIYPTLIFAAYKYPDGDTYMYRYPAYTLNEVKIRDYQPTERPWWEAAYETTDDGTYKETEPELFLGTETECGFTNTYSPLKNNVLPPRALWCRAGRDNALAVLAIDFTFAPKLSVSPFN